MKVFKVISFAIVSGFFLVMLFQLILISFVDVIVFERRPLILYFEIFLGFLGIPSVFILLKELIKDRH